MAGNIQGGLHRMGVKSSGGIASLCFSVPYWTVVQRGQTMTSQSRSLPPGFSNIYCLKSEKIGLTVRVKGNMLIFSSLDCSGEAAFQVGISNWVGTIDTATLK